MTNALMEIQDGELNGDPITLLAVPDFLLDAIQVKAQSRIDSRRATDNETRCAAQQLEVDAEARIAMLLTYLRTLANTTFHALVNEELGVPS